MMLMDDTEMRAAGGDDEVPGVCAPAPVVGSLVMISDDLMWRQRMAAYLASEGFVVLVDPTGDVAFDSRARAVDAAIIDLRLATRPAAAVCEAWCQRSTGPVLAVDETDDESTVLNAYAAGADHVAPVDISGRQLVARLRSLLRRAPARRDRADESTAVVSPVLLDAAQRVALVRGTKVFVTQQEFDFLELLLERAGRVVPRAELATTLLSSASSGRALDFFVRRLREKLERVDGQRRITVVRGVGFRFDVGTVTAAEVPT